MLEARSPLHDVLRPGCYGSAGDMPGVALSELRGRKIVQLAGWPGSFDGVVEQLPDILGHSGSVLRVGAERVWVVGDDAGISDRLHAAFSDEQAVVLDLSHSRTVISVDGRMARRVLAKGFPIDLHADVFEQGGAAQTAVGHIGVLVRRTGGDRFEIYVPRSYAVSFWTWLTESAFEAGYTVT